MQETTYASVMPGKHTSAFVWILSGGAFSLFILALIGTWFLGALVSPPFTPPSVLAEDVIVDGMVKNEKIVKPGLLSDAALAAVTVQPSPPPVAAPPAPSTSQAFLAFFSNKTVSAESEGVIQWMDAPEGLFSIKDKETGVIYTVFAPASTKIMRGGETLTFGALKIADAVIVEGKRERNTQLILASSVFVTSTLSIPPAL